MSELGGINIPFDGSNLAGKGIGLFKKETIALLVNFASGASDANDQKERLHAVLGGSKQGIEDFLSQTTKPKVRWSAYVTNGPGGPWATMQMLPTPFLATSTEKGKDGKAYAWPDEFKVKDGDSTVTLKRYTSGEPGGSEPKMIPVDPTSQGAVCPDPVLRTGYWLVSLMPPVSTFLLVTLMLMVSEYCVVPATSLALTLIWYTPAFVASGILALNSMVVDFSPWTWTERTGKLG